MPVALKLSKQFYDTFGEQVANEFVDAINQVDATYRSELKELIEQNFARFEAKQELRLAQFEHRFAQFETAMVKLLEARSHEMYTFMLLGWGTTIAAVIASVIGGAFLLR